LAILDFPVDGKANIRGGAAGRLFAFGIAARTFAMNVSQIHDGEGEPVEMKIELEKEAAN